MNYTIFLTQQANRRWYANIPALPDCHVEAPSRDKALERIQKRVVSIVTHSERLNLTIEGDVANPKMQVSTTPWHLFGMGEDDPSWEVLFDEIEASRDAQLVGS